MRRASIFPEFIFGLSLIIIGLSLFLSSCASSSGPLVENRTAVAASYDDSLQARTAVAVARDEQARAEQWEAVARQRQYWRLHERIAQGQAESYRARSNAAWERYRYLSENYQ